MAFGRVEVGLKNGKNIIAPFSARILVDSDSVASGSPRLTEFRGYVVSLKTATREQYPSD